MATIRGVAAWLAGLCGVRPAAQRTCPARPM